MPPNQYQPTIPNVDFSSKRTKLPVWFILVFTFILLGLILSLVFSFWAFANMNDYKNNSDQKSSAAVEQAKAEQKKQLEAVFAETEKSPLKTYITPSQYGSVKIVYPKTWSAYVVEQTGGNMPVDGYFYKDYVPGVNNTQKTSYSLRLQVVNSSYANVTESFKLFISTGKLKAGAFMPGVQGATAGVRLDGQIASDKKGSMVVVPLRDKVLKIWTEDEFTATDFNNYVIKNLTFSP